jgi:hypothetical protein
MSFFEKQARALDDLHQKGYIVPTKDFSIDRLPDGRHRVHANTRPRLAPADFCPLLNFSFDVSITGDDTSGISYSGSASLSPAVAGRGGSVPSCFFRFPGYPPGLPFDVTASGACGETRTQVAFMDVARDSSNGLWYVAGWFLGLDPDYCGISHLADITAIPSAGFASLGLAMLIGDGSTPFGSGTLVSPAGHFGAGWTVQVSWAFVSTP